MSHSLHHTDAADTAKLLQELDRDSKSRSLTGGYKTAMTVLFVLYSLTMIVMALVVSGATQYTRLPVFVGMTLFVGYLKYPASKRDALRDNYFPWYDVILAFTSLGVFFYYAIEQKRIIQMANRIGTTQIVLGIIGILLLVELCRRSTGIPLIVVAGLFTVYGAWWLTNNNPKTALRNLIYNLFYNLNCGIFSSPITVCASFIVLFIILGSFLEKTGIGTFFVDLANSIAGASVGGPAKVAVISSALEGMYSGSSVANTVGSGSITIPTMKKVGYKPEFAAAVEAAASTGGQIMPPIMGAAAFLMAEFVGIPYMEVVKAAIVPAILYFLGVFLGVHFEAKKNHLEGTPRSQLEPWGKIMKEEGHLAIPLIAIIALLASGYTPMKAALAGIFISIGTAMLRASTRMSFYDIVDGLVKGARGALGVIIACASAGMIIGIVTKTGVGLKLASALVTVAAGNFMLLLLCTMLTSLILGMGVPTTANYVITSTIAAPALIQLGVPILAAHMFVFYFGIIADITPPVALAAYAGSAISGGDPLKTGVNASKLGIAAFIIPYVFVLSPQLLGIGATFGSVLFTTCTAIIGMTGISGAMIGQFYCKANVFERLLLLAGGLCLIDPHTLTDIIGVAILAGVFALQYFRTKKAKAAEA